MRTRVRQTSIDAYRSLDKMSYRMQRVLEMLGKRPMCNTEISKAMNLPINSITGITNRLVKDDLVEEAYRAPSPQTGVRVIFWKAIKGGQTTLL